MYVCLLLFSSLSYGLTFKFIYFTLPLASLCFPLLFLLAAILADTLPIKTCIRFLFGCSMVNYLIVWMLSGVFNVKLHDFWIENWHTEIHVYGLLSLGYHIALATCIALVYFWRHKQHHYNYLTVSVAAIMANLIDFAFMWPALYGFSNDNYLATWKLLTMATFKINMLLLSLPLAWLVLWVQRYSRKLSG